MPVKELDAVLKNHHPRGTPVSDMRHEARQNSTSLQFWTPSRLRHEARLQFGAPILGSKLDPVSVPFLVSKLHPRLKT